MKKILTRITAAAVAASMLVTQASAELVIPEWTDPGTSAGSGIWLGLLYNDGSSSGKPATDYGIDYSAIAGAKFTVEVDRDSIDLFQGDIGGAIVFSCNSGDIYPYESDPSITNADSGESPDSEVWNTYNWVSHQWWGVYDEELGISTDPNKDDDFPSNYNPVSAVALGDATYELATEFVNPLTCETDEWEINHVGCMQIALQEWGTDPAPINVLKCEILDADGNVLMWFDGNGTPSLDNIADDGESDDTTPEEPEDTDNTIIHPGANISSSMYLVQLYNTGNEDEDKPATDYGIDYAKVSQLRFTIEPDKNGPIPEESYEEFFTGGIGGGIVLSCGGEDIAHYEDPDDTSVESEAWITYGWQTQCWWGVNDEELGINTDPNYVDDDPANDYPVSAVALGNYTYQLTAEFINPLSCETDEWDINEIAYMQIALQQWGNDALPFVVAKCEVLDAEGNVLVWFDRYGNPSLENLAYDGTYVDFYIKNIDGDETTIYDSEDVCLYYDREGACQLSWYNIQNLITDEEGNTKLLLLRVILTAIPL